MFDDSFNTYSDNWKKMSDTKIKNSKFNQMMVAGEPNPNLKSEMKFSPNIPNELKKHRSETSLASSFTSKSSRSSTTSLNSLSCDDRDFTRVKTTITSNLRYKIARNEPIKSRYYNEHIKTFGKPPFILGTRAAKSSKDAFCSNKRIIQS